MKRKFSTLFIIFLAIGSTVSSFAYNNTLPNGQRVEMQDGVIPYIGFDGTVITAPMSTWSQVGGGFSTPPSFNYGTSSSQTSSGNAPSNNGYVDPGSLMAQAFAASFTASHSQFTNGVSVLAPTDPNYNPNWSVKSWTDTTDPNQIKSILGMQ